MKEYLISIVIPAYNIQNYIERCLQSVVNQTYHNLEIIVVDDGSTDNTGYLIDKFAKCDKRIITIHKQNGGVSSARMCGIDIATGEYIGFVDGDDYIEPKMFEHLLDNAIKYNADISHCGYQMVFPDGHIDLYYGTQKLVEQNHEKGLQDLVKGDYIEPALWNKLFHKSIMEEVKISYLWDSSIRINEDLLMNYILFSKSTKSVYEDIPFYHYILREGSAATSRPQLFKLLDPLKVIELILKDSVNNEVLYSSVFERYLRVLISIAQQDDWKNEANNAQRELKKQIKLVKNKIRVSKKVKVMAYAISYVKPIYKFVRFVYDAVTGNAKKYNL